ncbi:MAG: hypothetical protein IMY72_07365 [Bacteroidetes bacterium]|nr:hypothetical protein [Bacteroidota bacterium]
MSKKTSHIIGLLFVIILIIISKSTFAITKLKPNTPDSIFVKGGNYIVIDNKLMFFKTDTTIYISDTTTYNTDTQKAKRSAAFYKKLEKKVYNKKFASKLYGLLFVSESDSSSNKNTRKSESEFLKYQGKIIKNISIKTLDVFGTNIYDTLSQVSSFASKTANRIHIRTNKRIIKNNLLFNLGDTVDPYVISDNERIIRDLSFITDSRIIINPETVDTNFVNIIILTKDAWTMGLEGQIYDRTSGRIDIFDKNIFGTGNQQINKFYLNSENIDKSGYKGYYRINNIKGSFISGELKYFNLYDRTSYEINFKKKFLTPEVKYAGGLTVNRTFLYDNVFINDSLTFTIPLNFNYQDLWIGKSIKIQNKINNSKDRTRLILSARLMRKEFTERPNIKPDSNQMFYNISRALVSIGISKQHYYKTKLIRGFGKTEDIPYGSLLEFTFGSELDNYENRFYSGLSFSKGIVTKKLYYFNSKISVGSYFNNNTFENAIIRFDGLYLSKLINFHGLKTRHYFKINYTNGIKRYDEERININRDNGIRDFSLSTIYGKKRFSAKLENVIFPSFYFYGFGVAIFSFLDFGVVGNNNNFIFKNKYYSGIGIGFKIRNDNLVLNSLEIRIAYYPRKPPNYENMTIHISNQDFEIDNFSTTLPDVIKYE